MTLSPTDHHNLETIKGWGADVFKFTEEVMGMRPAEPVDELRGKPIYYKDGLNRERTTMLFDNEGRVVHPDLSVYSQDMFKWQTPGQFRAKYHGTRFTWQQTLALTAYNRALSTFDSDSYDAAKRWITIRSGHGTGKTASLSVIALHFLTCFFGAQVGATANTEQQLEDILMKELFRWKEKMPDTLKNNFEQVEGMVRVMGAEDWFLRARVARPEKPEALAGLHGQYVLIIVDEASAVADKVYEVMKGALTGMNFIVIYTSNPTRTEGEFFESHKDGSRYTRLHFDSRHSPIVEDGYVQGIIADYGETSDEFRIRVAGQFASVSEMDDKGWIPLFANVNVLFEPENHQIVKHGILGVDPSGQGKDHSIITIRDSVYMKIVLNEQTSNEKDLARKIETAREVYECESGDIGIDAFGIGAKVVAEVTTKVGESVRAILQDKPREGTEQEFHSFKAELAWKYRKWLSQGGIIITNNPREWLREMNKVKYKRDRQGRIQLMGKVEFKKEYGFSPDRFDASCLTFFKDEPSVPVIMTKMQLENQEWAKVLNRIQKGNQPKNFSSMPL